jgi:hypothetical protein
VAASFAVAVGVAFAVVAVGLASFLDLEVLLVSIAAASSAFVSAASVTSSWGRICFHSQHRASDECRKEC